MVVGMANEKPETAAVAGVECGVGLDERFDAEVALMVLAEAAGLGADDAGGNGGVETEGVAHGQYPFADLYGLRVTESDRGEVFSVNFDQCQVGSLVGADYLGVVAGVVVEQHLEFIGAVHHMVVRDDVAVLADYHSRAETALHGLVLLALLLRSLLTRLLGVAEKEIEHPEGIVAALSVWILLAGGVRLDTYHGIDRLFGRLGKVRLECRCGHRVGAGSYQKRQRAQCCTFINHI